MLKVARRKFRPKLTREVEVTTVRNHLKDVLGAIEKGERLIITRRGKDIAAVIDPDDLEDFEALSSPNFLRSIKASRADIEAGRVHSHEEVFGKI